MLPEAALNLRMSSIEKEYNYSTFLLIIMNTLDPKPVAQTLKCLSPLLEEYVDFKQYAVKPDKDEKICR